MFICSYCFKLIFHPFIESSLFCLYFENSLFFKFYVGIYVHVCILISDVNSSTLYIKLYNNLFILRCNVFNNVNIIGSFKVCNINIFIILKQENVNLITNICSAILK